MAPDLGARAGVLDSFRRSPTWRAAAVAIAVLCFAAASYIEVPMVPVPITAQTYALLAAAGLLGWKLATLATVLWLVLGALGLPVLAGGAAGAAHFVGPTAGYLFAFPLATALAGWLVERGWTVDRPALAFVAMLLGHAVCLGVGGAWLALTIGPVDALTKGVLPFLVGGAIKSALVVATMVAVHRLRGAQHRGR